jgi:hypothetical protein
VRWANCLEVATLRANSSLATPSRNELLQRCAAFHGDPTTTYGRLAGEGSWHAECDYLPAEVITMTMQEAQERASRLGLSAWIGEAVVVGRESSEIVEIMCIGFVSADLAIAEGESWEEALQAATRIIFSA